MSTQDETRPNNTTDRRGTPVCSTHGSIWGECQCSADQNTTDRALPERASDLSIVIRHGFVDLSAAMEQAVRSAYLTGVSDERRRCALVADNYGREGDRLSKKFACEVADEIAARIRCADGK